MPSSPKPYSHVHVYLAHVIMSFSSLNCLSFFFVLLLTIFLFGPNVLINSLTSQSRGSLSHFDEQLDVLVVDSTPSHSGDKGKDPQSYPRQSCLIVKFLFFNAYFRYRHEEMRNQIRNQNPKPCGLYFIVRSLKQNTKANTFAIVRSILFLVIFQVTFIYY